MTSSRNILLSTLQGNYVHVCLERTARDHCAATDDLSTARARAHELPTRKLRHGQKLAGLFFGFPMMTVYLYNEYGRRARPRGGKILLESIIAKKRKDPARRAIVRRPHTH
ncbi:unnamed protein product [Trichogramma brassicae]|uniref:Uncharacterized protein n=1 Tax=Trichogramma brassicae TaxID=86971 RepID=A0A6H5I3P6_9HYME|nr:unnamed protein product [Trichogramma brassicae]